MGIMSAVRKTAPSQPARVYAYAAEKWGKTSWAAHAPEPVFVMTEGETGLLSLLEAGRVPDTSYLPECKTWDQLTATLRGIRDEDHTFKTCVIDTENGAERMLQSYVCEEYFNGLWNGKEGYNSYGKGDQTAMPLWSMFLGLLDEIRLKRRMSVLLLAHSKVKGVSNPTGKDYDQVRPEGVEKLWSLTHKWADAIVFGTWEMQIKDDKVTGQTRILRTSGTAAAVAGNRYGLPEVIQCGTSAKSAWDNFQSALAKAKRPQATQPPVAPPVPVVQRPEEISPTPQGYNYDNGNDWPIPEPEAEPTKLVGADEVRSQIVSTVLDAIHQTGKAWPELRDWAGKLIGRPLGEGDYVDCLSAEEAAKVVSEINRKLEERKK